MTNLNTQWRITVAADTKAARSELAKFAKTANAAGVTMEQMFSNVKGAPVARTFKNLGRELDKMNTKVLQGKTTLSSFNRYWKNSGNLIRHNKQLLDANSISIEKTNGSLSSATATMKRFNQYSVTGIERLAYMNTWFKASSRQAINWGKNIQWAGRQITVGFGVPFGLLMAGASMAFLKFEEQLVRFRKVFNDEIGDLSIDEAERRVTSLANTMSTQLGVARDEVMETSALFAQMGYDVANIERLTKATTELALLGETDAQEAGKLLRAYSASGFVDTFIDSGGSREDFEDYIKNMLNMIENNTGLSIASMVEAGMAQLIPLFSQMGVGAGIGESILAGMTEALGGRTSEAVTALKAIMQRVYDESAETTEQFSLIGIDIEYLQNKYTDDFVGLITELGDTLANNPEIQNNNKAVAETFGNLFGVRQANRAIAGLRAVAGAYDETGAAANDYGRALNSIKDPAEAARRAQAEQAAVAESLNGRLKRLKETIMIAASDVGESFLEMVMPLVRVVSRFINWFNEMSENTKRFALSMGLLVVGVGGLLTSVGVLTQAFIYMVGGLAKLFPSLRIVNEEWLKQKIATDHLNDSLKHLRTTAVEIDPAFDNLAQAQLNLKKQTQGATQALRDQQATMMGVPAAGAKGAGSTGSTGGVWKPGMIGGMPGVITAQGAYQPNYHPTGAGWFDANGDLSKAPVVPAAPVRPGSGPVILGGDPKRGRSISGGTSTRARFVRHPRRLVGAGIYSQMHQRPTGIIGGSIDNASSRLMSMNASNVSGRHRELKYTKGFGIAGTSAMLGSMFTEGEASSALMGGGIGLQGLAALSSSGVMDEFSGMAMDFAAASKSSTGIARGMNLAKAGAATMLGSFTTLLPVIVTVAATTYLFMQHLKKVKAEANKVRNELQYSGELAEELGMNLSSSVIQAGSIQLDSQQLEDSSDAVKSLVADIDRVKDSGGNIQEVFRNISRQWLAGGATIDEVNEKLDELEAEIGIVINEQDLETLSLKLEQDLTGAMQRSVDQFYGGVTAGFQLLGGYGIGFGDFKWGESPFSEQNMEAIAGQAEAFGVAMNQALSMDNTADAIEFIDHIEASRKAMESSLSEEDQELYIEEYIDALSETLGISDRIADGFETANDAMSYYFHSFTENSSQMKLLTEEQQEIMLEFAGSDEFQWDGFGAEAYGTLQDIMSLTGDYRNLLLTVAGDKTRMSLSDIFDSGDPELLQEYIDGLHELIRTGQVSGTKLGHLTGIIHRLNDALIAQRGWEYNIKGYYEGVGQSTEELLDEILEDVGEDTGTDSAEKYLGAFRSEVESQRDEVKSALMDAFNDASEARMEALEDERDRRIELLEDERDAVLDGLKDQRDAEIEAVDSRIEKIDEYLDKQKEIQEAMQNQIDLAVALASGERGEAAQIQNSMRFGTIEDMADSEKDRLKDQKDGIKEEYDDRIDAQQEYFEQVLEDEKELFDTRMENERTYREQERDNLEDRLDELDRMSLRTQHEWNEWYGEATGEAANVGATLDTSMIEGFQHAKEIIAADTWLDKMWSDVDMTWLGDTVADQVALGFAEGLSGANDLWGEYLDDVGPVDEEFDNRDRRRLLDEPTEGFFDWVRERVNAGEWHQGGPVPGAGVQDVPAVLQSGEYVIQRSAVQALGRGYLDQLNNYHTGGIVRQTGKMMGLQAGIRAMGMFDPEPARGRDSISPSRARTTYNPGGGTSGSLQPPDSDRTWRYSDWKYNVPANIATKFAAALSMIPGGQAVTSAYRSPSVNKSVGGAPNSDHMTGKGLDFMDMSNNSLSNLNKMGGFFQGRPGVRWVGMPKTDPTGGHDDHVHVSYYHNGGLVGRGGGKRVQVPTRPKAQNASLQMNSSGLTLNIGEFHGTEENIDRLAAKVGEALDRQHRKVNPRRTFG